MSEKKERGRAVKIGDTEVKSESFSVRELVIETEGHYPQFVVFQLAQDRTGLADKIEIGDLIDVYYDFRGRSWNGKYFTNINAWKIEKVHGEQPTRANAPKPAPAQATTENNDDDLPF